MDTKATCLNEVAHVKEAAAHNHLLLNVLHGPLFLWHVVVAVRKRRQRTGAFAHELFEELVAPTSRDKNLVMDTINHSFHARGIHAN